jgi:hypothetical protein
MAATAAAAVLAAVAAVLARLVGQQQPVLVALAVPDRVQAYRVQA